MWSKLVTLAAQGRWGKGSSQDQILDYLQAHRACACCAAFAEIATLDHHNRIMKVSSVISYTQALNTGLSRKEERILFSRYGGFFVIFVKAVELSGPAITPRKLVILRDDRCYSIQNWRNQCWVIKENVSKKEQTDSRPYLVNTSLISNRCATKFPLNLGLARGDGRSGQFDHLDGDHSRKTPVSDKKIRFNEHAIPI